MLKLKYLYHNKNLAEMLLHYWEFDEEAAEELFNRYRISSNVVYPFMSGERLQLLRFAPATEKLRHNLLAELDFIAYLRAQHYGVLEAVPARNGDELIEADTPWGRYYAAAFKRVPGKPISQTELTDAIVRGYGRALGRLHLLSGQYKPGETARWSHEDVLDWIAEVLAAFPDETAACAEAEHLREYFASIPRTEIDYGLIHYDFETDNVFFDPDSGSYFVIDFDDSMYHWYAMDIERAFEGLGECVPPAAVPHMQIVFMEGYLAEYDVPDVFERLLPACTRFARLYGYARIRRATAERWSHEPEWMCRLRQKLELRMKAASAEFGRPISVAFPLLKM